MEKTMSSTNKTAHLALNQWVGTDPFRMADFNEDNTKIDAAVKSNAQAIAANATAIANNSKNIAANATAISNNAKSIQSNATAIATLQNGAVRFATGSYTGNGEYGSNTKTTISFPFAPKIVFIVADAAEVSNSGALFLAGQQYSNGFGTASANARYGLTLTWSGNSLSWSSKHGNVSGASGYWQLNASGVTYRYLAIG